MKCSFWSYQDFKSEDLFFKSVLRSHSENTEAVARVHIKSPK